jgi:hypothetical protein
MAHVMKMNVDPDPFEAFNKTLDDQHKSELSAVIGHILLRAILTSYSYHPWEPF